MRGVREDRAADPAVFTLMYSEGNCAPRCEKTHKTGRSHRQVPRGCSSDHDTWMRDGWPAGHVGCAGYLQMGFPAESCASSSEKAA